jgi:hypothetical protein
MRSRVAFESPEKGSTVTLSEHQPGSDEASPQGERGERSGTREGRGMSSARYAGSGGEFVDSDIESEVSMSSALSTQSERPSGRKHREGTSR